MKKINIITLLSLLFFVMLSGCSAIKAEETVKEKEDLTAESGIAAGGLEPTLTTEAGEGYVGITFKVKNQTEHEQELTFTSGQKFDFIIKNTVGDKLYQWSGGRMFTQMIETVILQQGEELVFTERTEVDLEPGEYTIEVWMTAQETDVKASTSFKVAKK
jgi:hypothetical protein